MTHILYLCIFFENHVSYIQKCFTVSQVFHFKEQKINKLVL